MHLHSQYSEPLPQSSRGRSPPTDPLGELEGKGRDIGAQVKLLTDHSGTILGGWGMGWGVWLRHQYLGTELLLNHALSCINKSKLEEQEIMKENLCIFTSDYLTDQEKKKH